MSLGVHLQSFHARAAARVGCGLLVAAAALAELSCQRARTTELAAPAPAASSASDRLSAQEALPGRQLVFGVEVPSGMRVSSRFPDVAHLSGSRSVHDLIGYFSKHVAGHVELTDSGASFARVHVNGDPKRRVYRIEISEQGLTRHVTLSDVTPTPSPQGLSETERWQRAGLNSDGTLKDRLSQY
jgi:hypothetical protein